MTEGSLKEQINDKLLEAVDLLCERFDFSENREELRNHLANSELAKYEVLGVFNVCSRTFFREATTGKKRRTENHFKLHEYLERLTACLHKKLFELHKPEKISKVLAGKYPTAQISKIETGTIPYLRVEDTLFGSSRRLSSVYINDDDELDVFALLMALAYCSSYISAAKEEWLILVFGFSEEGTLARYEIPRFKNQFRITGKFPSQELKSELLSDDSDKKTMDLRSIAENCAKFDDFVSRIELQDLPTQSLVLSELIARSISQNFESDFRFDFFDKQKKDFLSTLITSLSARTRGLLLDKIIRKASSSPASLVTDSIEDSDLGDLHPEVNSDVIFPKKAK